MFDGKQNRIESEACWLTVNRLCNLKCRWCYVEGADHSPGGMSFELAKKLTLVSKRVGVRGVLLIGGEPTLWENIFEYNRFCRDLEMRSVLVTNAIRFGENGFWERYRKSPNDNMGVSLKAWNPQQLKEVARSPAFKKMRKGIERACTHFGSQVSITYNSFYCGELPDMVRFAVDCGATRVQINFCHASFIDNKPSSVYMVPPRELAKDIVESYPELMRITSGRLVFEMMLPFCLFPYEFIQELKERDQIISVCQLKKGKGLIWDEHGNILMCNALFDYPIGHYGTDFTNAESLEEWLNSETVLGYYNRTGAYPSSLCQTCTMYQDCGGGCPLRWAVYNPKDIVKPFN